MSIVVHGTESPITVVGLPAGKWAFTVQANTAAAAGLASAPTAPLTVTKSSFTPAWSDEFTGTALSWATANTANGTWAPRGNEGGDSDFGRGYSDYAGESYNCAEGLANQYGVVTVSNSVMTITAKRNPGIPGVSNAWIGAMLVSNRWAGLTWKYGYFEWRMRLPNPVRGMFPALWFYNNTTTTPASYSGAEIDLIEVFGNSSGTPQSSGVHYAGSGLPSGASGAPLANVLTDSSGWHRYGLDWQVDHIAFYKDGVLQDVDPSGNVISPITGAGAAWFAAGPGLGIRMDYVMNPSFAGPNQRTVDSGQLDPPAGAEPRMEVDYIRYYPILPAGLPTGSGDPLG